MKASMQIPLGGQVLVADKKHALRRCPVKAITEGPRAFAGGKESLLHLGLGFALAFVGWG
jgi:hypothetical protein